MSKLMSLALADLEYHGIPAESQRAKRIADLEAALAAAERIYEELMNEEYGCPTCAAPFDSPDRTCEDSAGCKLWREAAVLQRSRRLAEGGSCPPYEHSPTLCGTLPALPDDSTTDDW